MNATTQASMVTTPITKKKSLWLQFFRHFGHDARHDWLFLLGISGVLTVSLIVFATWVFIRIQSEKAFSFETESVSVPSITTTTDALTQTIESFEKKKVRFNSIRQIGVSAYDPSL